MLYRRCRIKGGTYFFTVVTYNRRKILCESENVNLLRSAFRSVMEKHPFHIDAIVILPDHMHCIWTLPPKDDYFSTRWRLIKSTFSRTCNQKYTGELSASRIRKKEVTVWQRRFWEHAIRDENDFARHVEYIHYNPVKHNLAVSPWQWPYSSFRSFVKKGLYDRDWGITDIVFGKEVGRE